MGRCRSPACVSTSGPCRTAVAAMHSMPPARPAMRHHPASSQGVALASPHAHRPAHQPCTSCFVLPLRPSHPSHAAAGLCGLMDPVEPGLACGSDTAHLSLFGCGSAGGWEGGRGCGAALVAAFGCSCTAAAFCSQLLTMPPLRPLPHPSISPGMLLRRYDPRTYYRGRGAFESMGAGAQGARAGLAATGAPLQRCQAVPPHPAQPSRPPLARSCRAHNPSSHHCTGLDMAPGDIAFKSNFATLDPASGIVLRRRADRRCAARGRQQGCFCRPARGVVPLALGTCNHLTCPSRAPVLLLLVIPPAPCPCALRRFEDLGPVLCAALDGLRLPSFPQARGAGA